MQQPLGQTNALSTGQNPGTAPLSTVGGEGAGAVMNGGGGNQSGVGIQRPMGGQTGMPTLANSAKSVGGAKQGGTTGADPQSIDWADYYAKKGTDNSIASQNTPGQQSGTAVDQLLNSRHLYGRSGQMLWNPQGNTAGPETVTDGSLANNVNSRDPRYFEEYTTPGSEGGGGDRAWRMNQATMDKFNRNGVRYTQLNNTAVGNTPHAVRDPSRVEYDDEFGAMTPDYNITPDFKAERDDHTAAMVGMMALGGMAAPAMAAGNAATGVPNWVGSAMRTGQRVGGSQLPGAAQTKPDYSYSKPGPKNGSTNETNGDLPDFGNEGSPPVDTAPDSNPLSSFSLGNLGNLLSRGAEGYFNNRDLQDFKGDINDFYNRGDYNRENRPGQVNRLNEAFMNPDKLLQDKGYQAMRDRAGEDLSRKLNAKGYNMSGNELGELTKLRTEMDYAHIDKERSQLMQAANLGDPSSLARAGMGTTGALAQVRANRNAANASNAQGFTQAAASFLNSLGKPLSSLSGSASNYIRQLFSGEITMEQLPPTVVNELGPDFFEQFPEQNPDLFLPTDPAFDPGDIPDIYNDVPDIDYGDQDAWTWILGD
jgi:hypothetical protein